MSTKYVNKKHKHDPGCGEEPSPVVVKNMARQRNPVVKEQSMTAKSFNTN